MGLETRIDTLGWRKRLKAFRTGWPATSKEDIAYFDTGVTQFRYRSRGQGKPLLFMADPPVWLEFYDDLLARYAEKFRVIVFEPPAMGFSAVRAGYGFTFAETTREIQSFMEGVAGPGAITAFSCVGGFSSLAIAAQRPDLVDKIVLIQTPSWEEEVRWKHARDPQGVLGKPVLGQFAMMQARLTRAPDWFRLALGRKEYLEPFCACSAHAIKNGAGWAMASAFQHYLTDHQCPLSKAAQPMLILWGLADGSHPDTVRDSARKYTSGAVSVREYADIGHFPELEDVDLIYRDIAAFAGV